jgi:hypothetical protein
LFYRTTTPTRYGCWILFALMHLWYSYDTFLASIASWRTMWLQRGTRLTNHEKTWMIATPKPRRGKAHFQPQSAACPPWRLCLIWLLIDRILLLSPFSLRSNSDRIDFRVKHGPLAKYDQPAQTEKEVEASPNGR